MKNITNILLVVAIALSAGLYFKKSVVNISNPMTTIAGAIGDTNTTPRMIQTSISLSTTTALSLNNSSGDRLITSVDYYFGSMTSTQTPAGTGVANLQFSMSTSTDVYLAASTNYILNTTVATSSGPVYVASTTPGNSAVITSRIWGAGTNINLFLNSTSTATGSFTVRYLQL